MFFLLWIRHIFSQTALWQPVSPHYIQEETQVHLFVPATSSETVKDLLQKHAITHEYVTCLKWSVISFYMPAVKFVRRLCDVLVFTLGCYWPTPMSWSRCRRGTTRLTHEAAQLSMRDITVWRMYAFHITFQLHSILFLLILCQRGVKRPIFNFKVTKSKIHVVPF